MVTLKAKDRAWYRRAKAAKASKELRFLEREAKRLQQRAEKLLEKARRMSAAPAPSGSPACELAYASWVMGRKETGDERGT